jgi:hypothetical protein
MTREELRPRIRGVVEEVTSLDVTTFREGFEALGRPLVIRGGAREFPAFGRWNAEYLARKVGHVRAHHKRSVTNKHPDFDQPTLAVSFARGESTLGELFRAVTTGPEPDRAKLLFTGDEKFLLRRRDGVTTLDPDLEPLFGDVRVPGFVPEERLYTVGETVNVKVVLPIVPPAPSLTVKVKLSITLTAPLWTNTSRPALISACVKVVMVTPGEVVSSS